VIYGKDISEIETVNDWIDLIKACLDQMGIDSDSVEAVSEILESSKHNSVFYTKKKVDYEWNEE